MSDQPSFVVVDSVDPESGVAEVEFSQGFSGELPLWWLPQAVLGAAYSVTRTQDGVRFTPHPGGARALREKSKQALLDFSDEFGDEDSGDAPASRH